MNKAKIPLSRIAEKAGVSIATVSRVINNSKGVNPELRSRVESAILELDYTPRSKVQPAAEIVQPFRVGFLINDFEDEAYVNLIKGVLEVAGGLNIEVVIQETQRSHDREAILLKQFQERGVHGILNVANLGDLIPEYQKLLAHRFPLVFLVNPNNPKVPFRSDANIVTSDSEGTLFATKYLLDLGHRDILYLGDPRIPRFTGFKRAFKAEGVALNPDLVVDCRDTFEDGHAFLMNDFKNRRFTAVIAASDNIAMGCWFALTEMGHRIPEDCSLIGYNNHMASHLSLTTIAEPLREIGKNAIYLLHENMNNPQMKPRQVILRDSLIIRDSCRRV